MPTEISLVLSKQVNYHCQAMTNTSSFFNWMEDLKSWLEGCCNQKMWVQNDSRYVRATVNSESNGRENILITEKIEDGREASRGFTRQPHSLASLWLPWRWCRRFKPRVTLGKGWLESHLMQNSATTWFSQRFTSDENLAQMGLGAFELAKTRHDLYFWKMMYA